MPFHASRRQEGPQPIYREAVLKHSKEKLVSPSTRGFIPKRAPKTTVSTSGILKRKPMKEIYARQILRSHRKRQLVLEDPRLTEFRDGIEERRDDIRAEFTEGMEQINISLSNRVTDLQTSNELFKSTTNLQMNSIHSSLSGTLIQTDETDKLTKKVTVKVVKLEELADQFQSVLEEKEQEIELDWKEWQKVQNEIVELGKSIMGPKEAINMKGRGNNSPRHVGDKDYARLVELYNTEIDTKVEEMIEEVKESSKQFIDRMVAVEKEYDQQLLQDKIRAIERAYEEERNLEY